MLNANTHIILMGKTNTEKIMYPNMESRDPKNLYITSL